MRRWACLVVAAVMPCVPSTLAWADVVIRETTVVKSGDRSVTGERSTYIKDLRMRIEALQGGRTSATVYDLPGGTIIELDAPKRQARIREMSARDAQLQKEYPSERSTTTITPTGTTKTVAALTCEEYRFAIDVPLTKDGKTALTLTGTTCLAATADGAPGYQSFAERAAERGMVVGYASDNAILLAITRGQTELYRALSTRRGIPLQTDIAIGVDGSGMIAGMVRKAAAGTRLSTVTTVEVRTLDDTLFSIPAAWERKRN